MPVRHLKTTCLIVLSFALLETQATTARAEGYVIKKKTKPQLAAEAFAARDWTKAATTYEEVVKDNPDDGTSWFRLGYAWHAAGDLDKAIPAHRRAAQFKQVRTLALYNLGCAFALKGDKDAAFDALRQSGESGRLDPRQLEGDSDLQSLREDPRYAELLESLRAGAGADADDPHRQLDFWVGDWTVVNPKGEQVGANHITRLENGFVILEEWTSAAGGSGRSLNYFDPADKKWKQVWVDARGGVVRYEGTFKDGAMNFTGVYILPDGRTEIARATLTPQPDGKVRQFIEHSKDEGQTWYTYFDGTYVKGGK